MRHTLDSFHSVLGNCRAVAEFLGYTLRGYMKIRRKVAGGQALNPHVEAYLCFKASLLVSEPAKTSTEGVASVTEYISKNISGCQKEFNKALKRIKSLSLAGKSRKEIHAKLTEAGRITMCYATFCNLVKKENANEPFIPAESGAGKSGSRAASASKPASGAGTGRRGRPPKQPSRR